MSCAGFGTTCAYSRARAVRGGCCRIICRPGGGAAADPVWVRAGCFEVLAYNLRAALWLAAGKAPSPSGAEGDRREHGMAYAEGYTGETPAQATRTVQE